MTEQLTKTSTKSEVQFSKPIYNDSCSKISSGSVKELKGIPTFNNLIKLSIMCITFLLALLILCTTVVKYKQVNNNCSIISTKV